MIRYCLRDMYLKFRASALRSLLRPEPVLSIDPGRIDTILLIRLDRIGDMVASIPSIKALRKIFPSSRITALLSWPASGIARLVPEIDDVIVYRGFIQALVLLRQKRFCLVIDLLKDYTLKTAALASLAAGKITAGFDIESRGRFFNAAFSPPPGPKPMSRDLLHLAGFIASLAGYAGNIPDAEPVFVLPDDVISYGREFMRSKGIKDSDTVFGIAPGAKFPSQRWGEEMFAQIADRIAEKYNARILIIASQNEKAMAEKVSSLMRNRPEVVAGLPLDRLCGVIAGLRLLVANNSGPLHMAAAAGVATVSTMGPTVAAVWVPQGKDHIVVSKDLACSPCNRAVCRSHECMKHISLEEMAKAVDILMEKKP